mmetsp:Transcript_48578/g.120449  ORF Transcript_48578/g.120449 Transcript_48578/m.120449 type:complete len:265 (-) Transcript_48578:2191-2985(-)
MSHLQRLQPPLGRVDLRHLVEEALDAAEALGALRVLADEFDLVGGGQHGEECPHLLGVERTLGDGRVLDTLADLRVAQPEASEGDLNVVRALQVNQPYARGVGRLGGAGRERALRRGEATPRAQLLRRQCEHGLQLDEVELRLGLRVGRALLSFGVAGEQPAEEHRLAAVAFDRPSPLRLRLAPHLLRGLHRLGPERVAHHRSGELRPVEWPHGHGGQRLWRTGRRGLLRCADARGVGQQRGGRRRRRRHGRAGEPRRVQWRRQ